MWELGPLGIPPPALLNGQLHMPTIILAARYCEEMYTPVQRDGSISQPTEPFLKALIEACEGSYQAARLAGPVTVAAGSPGAPAAQSLASARALRTSAGIIVAQSTAHEAHLAKVYVQIRQFCADSLSVQG